MPAEQRGSVYPTSRGFGIQWRDEDGTRRRQAGFTSRSEARRWFEDIERKRMRGETPAPSPLTLRELVDEYLDQHVAEANTIRALRDRLKLAVDGIPVKPRGVEREYGLGSIRVERLDARAVGAWRKRVPAGSAWHAHKALRQVLSYAVRAKLTTENVAQLVPNPEPKRREVPTFGAWEELDRLGLELHPARASLPIVVAGTGLRPEEWLALEWHDIDLKDGVLHVRRVYTDGRIKDYGKQDRSRRRLPMRRRAVDALRASPQGFGSSVVYPGDNGGYLNLHAWRRDEWKPPLESAGLPYLVPYSVDQAAAHLQLFTARTMSG